jgi:coenzyme Q-binding protein COQ10
VFLFFFRNRFSPEQVFNIVAQVDKYQEFLPWCKESKILSVSSNGTLMKALLKIGFQVFTEEYISLVTLTWPSKIEALSFSKIIHSIMVLNDLL